MIRGRQIDISSQPPNWLYGNEKAIQQLITISNTKKIPQSIIFSGPKGIGKSQIAITFSKKILENEGPPTVNELRTTIHSEKSLQEIFFCRREFDETTKKYKTAITINQIRKLKEFFSLSQTQNNWRIAIIDAADEMNESSSNAILKVLEEPPHKSILILICHNYYNLKSTIISRCQRIQFSSLTEIEMENFLEKKIDSSEERNLILSFADGVPAHALSMIHFGALNTYRELIGLLSCPEPLTHAKVLNLIGIENSQTSLTSNLDLNDLILILVHRMIQSLIEDKKFIATTIEKGLFSKIRKHDGMAINLAELYLDMEQTMSRGKKLNIEKTEISSDCLVKVKKLVTDKICL